MREKAVEEESKKLKYVDNQYKTQNMCQKAVDMKFEALVYVSDWVMT